MDNSGKKILIIDEDLYLLGVYIKRLKEAGWDVDFATKDDEAVLKLSNESYSVVVLDVMIGRKPGVEILETLRSQGLLKNTSVVILTNNDKGEDVERAQELGALGYIIKAHNTPQEIAEEIDKIYVRVHKTREE